MKVDRRTQKEAPVVRGNLLPVMGDIRLDFPVFLIYPRQPVENLPGKVRFRAAQRRSGQQIEQGTIVEHAKNVFSLTETAAQMGEQHLAHAVFIAD